MSSASNTHEDVYSTLPRSRQKSSHRAMTSVPLRRPASPAPLSVELLPILHIASDYPALLSLVLSSSALSALGVAVGHSTCCLRWRLYVCSCAPLLNFTAKRTAGMNLVYLGIRIVTVEIERSTSITVLCHSRVRTRHFIRSERTLGRL